MKSTQDKYYLLVMTKEGRYVHSQTSNDKKELEEEGKKWKKATPPYCYLISEN